jgi:hypothetical protein
MKCQSATRFYIEYFLVTPASRPDLCSGEIKTADQAYAIPLPHYPGTRSYNQNAFLGRGRDSQQFVIIPML